MSSTNDSGGSEPGVRSLRGLSRDIPPPRDLWPAIAGEIAKDAPRGAAAGRGAARARPARMQWVTLAAVVAALAVGVWIGRSTLPSAGTSVPRVASSGPQDVVAAAYVRDPRYLKRRADLVRSLEETLKTLPPQTQTKVAASLATIRKSIADIQAALGRDPGNALLQELLVNSYQDEMRVLTAVHEAGGAGREI